MSINNFTILLYNLYQVGVIFREQCYKIVKSNLYNTHSHLLVFAYIIIISFLKPSNFCLSSTIQRHTIHYKTRIIYIINQNFLATLSTLLTYRYFVYIGEIIEHTKKKKKQHTKFSLSIYKQFILCKFFCFYQKSNNNENKFLENI